MGHTTCCIKNCHKNGKNSNYRFFSFPKHRKYAAQRAQWIEIVIKVNKSHPKWEPSRNHVICQSHFVGENKSRDPSSPAYLPSIFAGVTLSQIKLKHAALKRYERLAERRFKALPPKKDEYSPPATRVLQEHSYWGCESNSDESLVVPTSEPHSPDRTETLSEMSDASELVPEDENQHEPSTVTSCDTDLHPLGVSVTQDAECQVYTEMKPERATESFTCIRYYHADGTVDAEVQTDIEPCKIVNFQNKKSVKLQDQKCGTRHIEYSDACVGPNEPRLEGKSSGFIGVPSIRSEREYLSLAGVSPKNFQFLMNQINHSEKSRTITKENKLLMFLMKMKCGLSFTAISCIFSVHRTWVSKLFSSVLEEFTDATRNLVFWPSREVVRATMPSCFIPEYENVRVILDCTEFRLEIPPSVENRVLSYSHYKKGFTARALVGITPGGFISFISPLAGGRKSDCQITVESGLLNLLETGDVVLADKGFPNIQSKIDEEGKQVMVVLPPFLEKNNAFTKEETDKTYSVAKVRIHVERIMQRIRTYKIMDKIPAHLFKSADKIFLMSCVLVNLQPPIFDEKTPHPFEGEF
ncbi:hypothetical protein QAD02_010721 [Eretmocerus hayati]|uniref:Uncharacterized protein n=1 Tax=Eretmocerus hayati TaxID=131215 RepID=A0ACC2NUJ7_9HYME|nr:hypothetical protein QAD02_010721 [Eretmocerus hayati]